MQSGRRLIGPSRRCRPTKRSRGGQTIPASGARPGGRRAGEKLQIDPPNTPTFLLRETPRRRAALSRLLLQRAEKSSKSPVQQTLTARLAIETCSGTMVPWEKSPDRRERRQRRHRSVPSGKSRQRPRRRRRSARPVAPSQMASRSEEHTSELQSPCNLVCRLLLEKKKKKQEQDTG